MFWNCGASSLDLTYSMLQLLQKVPNTRWSTNSKLENSRKQGYLRTRRLAERPGSHVLFRAARSRSALSCQDVCGFGSFVPRQDSKDVVFRSLSKENAPRKPNDARPCRHLPCRGPRTALKDRHRLPFSTFFSLPAARFKRTWMSTNCWHRELEACSRLLLGPS